MCPAVILGEECARAKPFPDPYLEGLKVLGIAPSEALVFEDSLSGRRANPVCNRSPLAALPFKQMAKQSSAQMWSLLCLLQALAVELLLTYLW